MEIKRSVLQLSRLERIMDVVFALVIWRLFTLLPKEGEDGSNWESVTELLLAEWGTFLIVCWLLLLSLFTGCRIILY